jgi:ATP-binding cassette subfamily C (CFTR/MRP) protein 5
VAQHAADAADSSAMVQLHDAVFVWEETAGMAGHSTLALLDMATDGVATEGGKAAEGPKGAAGRERQQGAAARDSEGGEGEKQKENGGVEAGKEIFKLRLDELRIRQGALVVVCGVIGSGKTSLLEALLGEMVRVGGRCDVYAPAAYASQVPWIVNATLRENVLFGRPYDERRYQQVSEGKHL